MASVTVHVDDATMDILSEVARRTGRSIADLASSAVAEEALRSVPPHLRATAAAARQRPLPIDDDYGKRPDIVVGLFVEVHRIVMFGPDRWLAARVIAVRDRQFDVEAVHRPLDDNGHTKMTLDLNRRGETWR